MSYRDIVRAQLRIDEGVRSKPYRDTVGKLTIGVGRNLDDVGLRPDEIDYLLKNDIAESVAAARALFQSFNRLSGSRKAVLVNMAFNLGQTKLAQFKRLRAAVAAKDFQKAAAEMLQSAWAKQVGARADRLAKLMEKG
jgi:lysozyme